MSDVDKSTTEKKVPVSFLVPVKNEAHNLPRCLSSISWANEIVVVDSCSVDGTESVARSFGASVVQFDFNGTWPKKKNWALDNLPFKHDWVFILDADEVLPESAADEINAIVTAPADAKAPAGYWVNRRFMFMNKWLKHAYFPNWNVRLFRHKLGRYEKLSDADTASGDNEVHEHIVLDGDTGYLKCLLDHYAFPTVDAFIEKHNRYSNWEARVQAFQMNPTSADRLGGPQRIRRRLKLLSQRMPFRPLLRFLYVYIWQCGFLDGIEGYYFARLHGFYEFLVIAKSYEIKKSRKVASDQFKSGR